MTRIETIYSNHAFTYWITRVAQICVETYGAPLPYQIVQPWHTWFEKDYAPHQVIFELCCPDPATYDLDIDDPRVELIVIPQPINLFCKTGV